MKLFWSHDLSHGFGRFAQVDLSFFFLFHHWVDWKLSFIICFDLLYTGLSWSHDPGYGFEKLT